MFDNAGYARPRIAVVGGGISGLASAYYLAEHYDVTVYEAEERLGGHARTVMGGKFADTPVDTGFIVFNYATYPNLTRLFKALNVPVIKSEMSFGASIGGGEVEYGLSSLKALTAQKRNLFRPQFYKMILDIIKFGNHAQDLAKDDDMTIGELISKLRLGRWFREYYLLPMCGAIWSTPTEAIDQFPAKSLIRFFRNHALLAGTGKHQWFTVDGGSIEYVKRLEAALIERGVTLKTGTPVTTLTRKNGSATINEDGGYDEVIFACHSNQALSILGRGARKKEKEALGAIRYQPNKAVLHADPTHMPKHEECWSSWAYRSQAGTIGVTYWMNSLQPSIPTDEMLFVTLNPTKEIAADKIYDEVNYEHPVFDGAALKAQKMLAEMQGDNNTWFVGAYHRHGFHEDGIASAMRVVRSLLKKRQHQGGSYEIDGQGAEAKVPVDLRATA